MSDPPQPPYMTSHSDCVEEVGHLAAVLAEMVELAGDFDANVLTDNQLRHRLQTLVELVLDRPSVQRARRRGGAR
jgi:hypothetical protein